MTTTPAPGDDTAAAYTHLAAAVIQGYLDRRATVGMPTASVHVYLRPLQTSWRPAGGNFVGPGVVHYWRFRDGGIGGVWLDTVTIGDVIAGARG